MQERIEYVLTQPYPNDLPVGSNAADRKAYDKQCDDTLNVSCVMIAAMTETACNV
jgi:hypothetical protein